MKRHALCPSRVARDEHLRKNCFKGRGREFWDAGRLISGSAEWHERGRDRRRHVDYVVEGVGETRIVKVLKTSSSLLLPLPWAGRAGCNDCLIALASRRSG